MVPHPGSKKAARPGDIAESGRKRPLRGRLREGAKSPTLRVDQAPDLGQKAVLQRVFGEGYLLPHRELAEMLEARGIDVDHSTICRWVQYYATEMEKRLL